MLTAVNYTSRPPKEEDLKVIARMVNGGPEVLLRDNSWPRIVNPDEIAAACAANPILMQRPLIVSPDHASAVCRPITSSTQELSKVIHLLLRLIGFTWL